MFIYMKYLFDMYLSGLFLKYMYYVYKHGNIERIIQRSLGS